MPSSFGVLGCHMAVIDGNETMSMIFPLVPNQLQRFFEDRKTVFVKFTARQAPPERLRIGSRLFFYESRRKQEVVGEARIAEISTGTIEQVLARFGDKLFLTQTELNIACLSLHGLLTSSSTSLRLKCCINRTVCSNIDPRSRQSPDHTALISYSVLFLNSPPTP